jgi:hypothetical protein
VGALVFRPICGRQFIADVRGHEKEISAADAPALDGENIFFAGANGP